MTSLGKRLRGRTPLLLDKFSADEIETVLAHELGHHVHKDIALGIIFQTVLIIARLWLANAIMLWGIRTFGYTNLIDPAGLGRVSATQPPFDS